MTRDELTHVLENAKVHRSNGRPFLRLDTDERTAYDVLETTGVGSVRPHRNQYRWYLGSTVDIEAILSALSSDTWADELEELQRILSTSRAGYREPKTSLAPRIERTVDPEELAWAKNEFKRIIARRKQALIRDPEKEFTSIATDARIHLGSSLKTLKRLQSLFGGTIDTEKPYYSERWEEWEYPTTGTWRLTRRSEVRRARELLEI